MDKKLEEKLDAITPIKLKEVRKVSFKYPVLALTGVRLEEPCPLSGLITEVTMHWPDGCGSPAGPLVAMSFGHRDVHVSPGSGMLWLNNATPSWRDLHEEVKKGETLWAVMENHDGLNPHNLSVIVVVQGVE